MEKDELKNEEVSNVKSNLVTIDKEVLDDLLSRVENVEHKLIQPAPSKITKRKKMVKVRRVGDQYVCGYGKTWEDRAIDGHKFLMIEVKTVDGNVHKLEYIKFNESEDYVLGEVIETKLDESRSEEKITGYVNATVYDRENYSSYQTDKEVPLVVTIKNYIFKILLPDGQVIELPDNAVN